MSNNTITINSTAFASDNKKIKRTVVKFSEDLHVAGLSKNESVTRCKKAKDNGWKGTFKPAGTRTPNLNTNSNRLPNGMNIDDYTTDIKPFKPTKTIEKKTSVVRRPKKANV